MKRTAIEAVGLTRHFGSKTAVNNLDLQIAEGEFFGFLGPNGAGKSTTMNMLVGLLRPSAGKARIQGIDIWHDPLPAKRLLGVLPEGLNLYQRLSANEFVRFVGTMYDVPAGEVDRRAAELIDLLDLTPDADKLIIDYSHGMRKKTALAAALIHGPRILFLDEPFEGIDAISGRVIRDVLRRLRDQGTTIFFSSHILEIVERLCSRVGVIANGQMVAVGTISELRDQAQTGAETTLEDLFIKAVGASDEIQSSGKLSWLE